MPNEFNFARFARRAQNADIELVSNNAGRLRDTSGLRKVFVVAQTKEDLAVLLQAIEVSAGVLKGGIRVARKIAVEQQEDQIHFATCGSRVNQMNLTVGLFGKHHVTRGGRGIVASRDALGDGHANRLVSELKELSPLPYAWAGAR